MEDLSSYIFQSNLSKAEQLINSGYDINGFYGIGIRPIISAINSDNPETLQFVIRNGANVNIDNGMPLAEAIDYCLDGMRQNDRVKPYPEALEAVSILIKSGANPIILDEEGKRPIDILLLYASDTNQLSQLKSFFRAIIPEIEELTIVEN